MDDELARQIGNYVISRINEIANEKVEQKTKAKKVTISLKGLAAMTGMSESYLRENVLDKIEFLKAEHDIGKKRLWNCEEAEVAWKHYLQCQGKRGIDRLPRELRKKLLS